MCEKYFDYLFLLSDLNSGLPNQLFANNVNSVNCKQFEP